MDAGGWLRGLASVFDGVACTNLQRDPDDPYDPADDLPYTVVTRETGRSDDTQPG